MDCQNLSFSPQRAQDRVHRAQQSFGEDVVQRILCFALFLLGVNRNAIGQFLGIPGETVKSIIKAINRDGLCALEDRRRRQSIFLPQSHTQPAPITLHGEEEHLVVDFGIPDRQLKLPRHNPLQVRLVLLSLLNDGLLSSQQVAEAIGLTPAYTATLANRLSHEDIISLVDKRAGQKVDYRITPEIKAELIQQFAADLIAHGRISSSKISEELEGRCNIVVPARTVRHHITKMGLPGIKDTLPQLLAAVKKTSNS